MKSRCKAQSAVEYLLLLAIVGVVVVVGFQTFLPKTQETTEGYFNTVSRAIIGGNGTNEDGTSYNNDPKPIDGGWCDLSGQPLINHAGTEECESGLPCGAQARYRECACPSPAFGGKHCMETKPEQARVLCTERIACKDCPANDPCIIDNPLPSGCGHQQGTTQCGHQACTIYYPCGTCQPPQPANTVACRGNDTETVQPWSILPSWKACTENQTSCTAYCQDGTTLNAAGTACQ